MSSANEQIALPSPDRAESPARRLLTPLNVTLAALASLLLPSLETLLTTVLFLVARPLLIVLAVLGVALVVSLVNVVVGTLAGLRPRSLAAGPVQAYRGPDGWSLARNRSWRSFIGSVLMVPEWGAYTRTQGVLLAGTGLLTSLVLAVYAFVEALAYGWPGVDDPGLSAQAAALLQALPVGAVIVFLAELLTGGTMLWAILGSSDRERQRVLANMTIAALMSSGRRPREWEPELVEQATSVPDTSADHLMGISFAYLHAVDNGNLVSANRFLHSYEQWLSESSSSVRPYVLSSLSGYASLYHERAWLMAAYREDLDRATEYLNLAADYQVAYPVELRVKAEILALEGDTDAARQVAEAAGEELERLPVQESWRIPFERDLLARILAHQGERETPEYRSGGEGVENARH